jgi:glycerol-1-phosphate dehydrogenase [NAD(P)+]
MSFAHSMELPRKVIVGRNLLSTTGTICKEMSFSNRALVFSGPHTFNVAAKIVIDSLVDSGFEVNYFIIKEPTMDFVKQAELKIKCLKPNIVLGVGGGKVIDVAKYSSANKNVKFISVPTAVSHDGISSHYASIKNFKGSVSVKAQAPMAIIADVDVISKSPYKLTASGCGDIIAKFTAVRDWKLAHSLRNEYYGEYAANLALMSARLIARNSSLIHEGSEEGVHMVVEALISCGVAISIAGSTRPCSGSEHLFSHALDIIAPKPALHGEQCGVGTIMMAYLHRINWKKIRSVLKEIGAPISAEELGIDSEFIIESLTRSHLIRPDRYTILGEKGLSRDSAVKLAKITGVVR